MVTVRKYATDTGENEGWSNPANSNGAPDGLCSGRVLAAPGTAKLYKKTYGFSIPAGSLITAVYVGGYYRTNGTPNVHLTEVCIVKGSTYWCSSADVAGDFFCSDCIEFKSLNCQSIMGFTVDELNNEEFETFAEAEYGGMGSGLSIHYLDAIYVEVEYSIPAVGAPYGDGLSWVVQMLQRKNIKNLPLIFNG